MSGAQHTPGPWAIFAHPFLRGAVALRRDLPQGGHEYMRNEAGGVCHWWKHAEARAAIAKAGGAS